MGSQTLVQISLWDEVAKVGDREALRFLYPLTQSLGESSAEIVQRWLIASGSHDYGTIRGSAKSIQDAEFLSSNVKFPILSQNSYDLFLQQIPIQRLQ